MKGHYSVGIQGQRGRRLRLCRYILLSLCTLSAVEAQESFRQPILKGRDSLRASSLSFERLLNTFVWNGAVFFKRDFNGTEINFRQTGTSRLIRTEPRSIQDEFIDTLDIGSKLNERWRLRAQVLSIVLSDNRAVDLGKLAQHRGLAGFQAQPSNDIIVNVLGGYEFDSQEGKKDEGFSYLAEAFGKNIALEEFRASFNSRWTQAFLSPRKPSSGNFEVALVRDFGNQTQDSIVIAYSQQRREFYTTADLDIQRIFQTSNNIFRRDAEVFDIANQLEYRPNELFRISLLGGVSNRTIDRSLKYKNFTNPSSVALDTRIQELNLFGMFSTFYRVAEWLDTETAIAYQEREERHNVKEEEGIPLSIIDKQERSERRLENISRRTTIMSKLMTTISEQDRLNFAGSASILRYDTPDATNIDDRDELLITLGVNGIHQFNERLQLSLGVDVTLSHLVYLHRLQSSNNNWNRIIRFSPTVEYAPSARFRTRNQAEVLANYTIYDFEGQSSSTKSFSFRQASWIDSTSISLTKLLDVNFVGGVRVYQRGILLWSEFKERPQNYFTEQSYWPKVMFSMSQAIRLGLGYRFFRQDRYRYEKGEKLFERRLETSGPTVAVEWEGIGNQRFSLEGWNETQVQDGQVIRTVPNLFLKVSVAL